MTEAQIANIYPPVRLDRAKSFPRTRRSMKAVTSDTKSSLTQALFSENQSLDKDMLLGYLKSTFLPKEREVILDRHIGLSDRVRLILAKLEQGRLLTDLDTRTIFGLLLNNFPYTNILRMSKGDVLRNFHFSGIKNLNDKFGQLFTDQIIAAIKTKIAGNIRRGFENESSRRTIRDNYKHLTYSSKQTKIDLADFYKIALEGIVDSNKSDEGKLKANEGILKNIPEIKNIIELAAFREFMLSLNNKGILEFNGLSTQQEDLDNNILACQQCFEDLKNSVLYPADSSMMDFEKSKVRINLIEEIRKFNLALNDLKINLGQSRVDSNNPIDNLVSFFKSERGGVLSTTSENDSYMVFDDKRIGSYLQEIDVLEQKIFEFEGKTFGRYKTNNQVIISSEEGKIINPLLLKQVRKGTNISNPQLLAIVKDYLSKINAVADCIKDGTFENLKRDFEIAKNIDLLIKLIRRKSLKLEKFSQDEIELLVAFLKTNQKGVITRQSFKDYVVKQKTGTLGYTDIKDMGFYNILSFREVTKKMQGKNGEIDFSKVLESGDEGTKRLMSFVADLKKYYGNRIVLTLGGDEIYRHITGNVDIDVFNAILNKYNLKGRNIYKAINEKEKFDIEKEIDGLDKSTLLVKFLEQKFLEINDDLGVFFDSNINFDIGDLDGVFAKKDLESMKKRFEDKSFEKQFIDFIQSPKSKASLTILDSVVKDKKYVLKKTRLGFNLYFLNK